MKRLWPLYCCLCLASCSNPHGEVSTVPVSGQVLVNGQPAVGVQITFHLIGEMPERGFFPSGITKEDGKFVLETYHQADGAPPGDYRVTLEWPAWRSKRGNGPDKLGNRFGKPETSGLTAHIDKNTRELPPFNLTATVTEYERKGRGQR
jgi:hypothetical protein